MSDFREFRAAELYCPTCRRAQAVRERLLLVLPNSELHEYRCAVCGVSLATRETRLTPAPPSFPPRRRRAPARGSRRL